MTDGQRRNCVFELVDLSDHEIQIERMSPIKPWLDFDAGVLNSTWLMVMPPYHTLAFMEGKKLKQQTLEWENCPKRTLRDFWGSPGF